MWLRYVASRLARKESSRYFTLTEPASHRFLAGINESGVYARFVRLYLLHRFSGFHKLVTSRKLATVIVPYVVASKRHSHTASLDLSIFKCFPKQSNDGTSQEHNSILGRILDAPLDLNRAQNCTQPAKVSY